MFRLMYKGNDYLLMVASFNKGLIDNVGFSAVLFCFNFNIIKQASVNTQSHIAYIK